MSAGPPLTEQQLDERIAEWHDAPDDGRELHEFLGLSWEQFAAWVECKPYWWEVE